MSKCPINGKPCVKYKAYHITEIGKNGPINLNICEDCLCQLDSFDVQKVSKDLAQKTLAKIYETCEFCGLTIEEFVKKGRLGCSKCYEKFDRPLVIALEKLHYEPSKKQVKKLRHVGRVPTSWKIKQAKETNPDELLLKLKEKLEKFVKEEKYRQANTIKEEISSLSLLINKLKEDNLESTKDEIYKLIYDIIEKESEENLEK